MKIGWSVQRHVSVNGLVNLLQMASTGRPVRELRDEYYTRMMHSTVDRLESEQIFSRNVQFLELYLEVLDHDGRLREEFRKEAGHESGAKKIIFQRSYENLLAFRTLMDMLNGQPPSDQRSIRNKLAKELLSQTKEKYPKEYNKKVTDLNNKYGSESLWIYPQPSIDRLLEIAALEATVTRQHGKIGLSWVNSAEPARDVELSDFKSMIKETYSKISRKTGDRIVSLDQTRDEICRANHMSPSQFNDLFDILSVEDHSLVIFSGKIGNEEGLLLSNGKHIFRYTIT